MATDLPASFTKDIVQRTLCPFAVKATIWSFPEWRDTDSWHANVRSMAGALDRYVASEQRLEVDAIVGRLGNPIEPTSMTSIASNLGKLLAGLSREDRTRDFPLSDEDLMAVGWQFTYGNVRFFLSIFAACYSPEHPRYSPNVVYIMFQPESSFRHHRVGGPYQNARTVKRQIRQAFAQGGQGYDGELIDRKIEPPLYLLARGPEDRSNHWWEHLGGDRASTT